MLDKENRAENRNIHASNGSKHDVKKSEFEIIYQLFNL